MIKPRAYRRKRKNNQVKKVVRLTALLSHGFHARLLATINRPPVGTWQKNGYSVSEVPLLPMLVRGRIFLFPSCLPEQVRQTFKKNAKSSHDPGKSECNAPINRYKHWTSFWKHFRKLHIILSYFSSSFSERILCFRS